MTEKETVLSFLEHFKMTPRVCTVDRTNHSKYLFYLIVRHYRRRFKGHMIFSSYSKGSVSMVKGQIEEHSLWPGDSLYVLEGYNQNFVDKLELPQNAYVLAETDGGNLKADVYLYWKKRDILKVLQMHLRLNNLSLRKLLELDWSGMQGYEDYEIILRKTKIMGWSEVELGERLQNIGRINLLTSLKKSSFKEIFDMIESQGPRWVQRRITTQLSDLMYYRALKLMGHDEIRIARSLDFSYTRVRELEAMSKMLTAEDMKLLAERLVAMDNLIERNSYLGISLFLLNAPIQVKVR